MALGLYQRAVHAVRYWLLRRLPTCKQIAPLMSQSLDRRLSLLERIKLKLHLWICIWCVWYLEHLHVMKDAIELRAAKVEENGNSSGQSLSTEARERLKLALTRKDSSV